MTSTITPEGILQHLLERSPWVDRAKTVDCVKFGDGGKPVSTVGVCWYAATETLREAARLKCDLVLTHEPLWWDHWDKPGGWQEHPVGAARRKVLEDSGITVLRLHDTWDNWPKIGIRDSFAAGLGLTRFVCEDKTRWHAMYEVPEQTLREFARYVASKVKPLGEDAVQVLGDPQQKVRFPSIGVGCGGPHEDMISRGSDCLIVCFDGAWYWRDRERFAEQGAGVITLEHGTTEMWGLESLAKYVAETWPQLKVHCLARHRRAWHVSA
jgi:putative NIF3 family GTP cyclohydrolase 1 type 2